MLLSALATQVEQVRIGVLVSSNTFRHPSVLAKQAVTLDHISNGRLELGMGAGWFKQEHDMFGLDFPETGELVDRYAEALDLLDRLPEQRCHHLRGRVLHLAGGTQPAGADPETATALVIGAHGPRMINLAAQYADTWNTRGTPEEMRERNLRMDAACAQERARPQNRQTVTALRYRPDAR